MLLALDHLSAWLLRAIEWWISATGGVDRLGQLRRRLYVVLRAGVRFETCARLFVGAFVTLVSGIAILDGGVASGAMF